MKTLPILSVLTIVVWAGLVWQQRDARALQAEPSEATEDTSQQATDDEQPAADNEEPAPTEETTAEPTSRQPDPEVAAACVALLQQSRDRLYAYDSVQARIVERAAIGPRSFTAEGIYIAGTFPQMRLEYTVQVGGSEGKLIEVCDGQILRSSKEIRSIRPGDDQSTETAPDEIQVTRKEVQKILQAGKEAGNAGSTQAIVQAELGLGGLPTLLAALETAMVFDGMREETWNGQSYTVIEGQWKQEYLDELAPKLGQNAQAMSVYMPERVRVYFDAETLFPMRILYLKQYAAEPATFRAILSLEMSDVRFNEELDPEVFRYIPPTNVNEIDETAAYLRMIEALRSEIPPGEQPTGPASPAAEPAP